MNLSDSFFTHACAEPDKPALQLGETTLSYHELAGRVAACHHRLQQFIPTDKDSCGADASESVPRIAWDGSNSPALVILYLACTRAGHTLVLLDPTWPEPMRIAALEVVSPSVVVNADHDIFRLSAGLPSQIRWSAENAAENAAASIFLIGFTSGSSGAPKPFVRTQASWLETFALAATEFATEPGYRVLAPGPMSHGLSFYAMAETLNNGGQFIALPQFDVVAVTTLLRDNSIHTLVVVPTMLMALLEHLDARPCDAAPVRVISAGAKLSERLRDALAFQFPETEIVEYYGASELSFVTVSQASESPPPQSVGRAFAGVEICLLNDAGLQVGDGDSGTIWVRSKMLADGYLEADGGIQSLVDKKGWATVGDVGSLDDNGNLTLIDRASNMLISGGLNVYPSDVERVLERHESVAEAIVIGVPDAYWGDRICALVRWQSDLAVTTAGEVPRKIMDSLTVHCQKQLTPQQRPARYFMVRQWPLTSSGKIDRVALIQRLTSRDSVPESDALHLEEIPHV